VTTVSASPVETITAAITDYLRQRFPRLGPIGETTRLLGSDVIDSLGFLELLMFLERRFGVVLDDADFDTSNLETAKKISALVERKLRDKHSIPSASPA
jgi:acyl carrier protein